jgi:Putative quorum-sensing-regulated virulence factor
MSFTMPFGKYRGTPIEELPDGYLHWLSTLSDLREPLLSAVAYELLSRFRSGQEPSNARLLLSDEVVDLADSVITAGYRKLSIELHPDQQGDHEAMVNLNQAVSWLRRQVKGAAA